MKQIMIGIMWIVMSWVIIATVWHSNSPDPLWAFILPAAVHIMVTIVESNSN